MELCEKVDIVVIIGFMVVEVYRFVFYYFGKDINVICLMLVIFFELY